MQKRSPTLSKNPDHVIDTKYGRDLLLSGKGKDIEEMIEINKAKCNNMIDLRKGDCLELMKDIPDKSIDAIICDPPIWNDAL